MYAIADGAFRAVRYGKGVNEADTWRKTANGWTVCEFNVKATKRKHDPQSRIVRAAIDRDEFFHSRDGLAYVTVRINGKPETLLVGEERYRHFLRLDFEERLGEIPKREWIANSIEQLQAHALQRCPSTPFI